MPGLPPISAIPYPLEVSKTLKSPKQYAEPGALHLSYTSLSNYKQKHHGKEDSLIGPSKAKMPFSSRTSDIGEDPQTKSKESMIMTLHTGSNVR